MLTVLIGSDIQKLRGRVLKNAKGYSVIRFGEGGEQFERVPDMLGAQGLFGDAALLLIDRPSESESGRELLSKESLALLHRASTPVYLLDYELGAETKKSIPKGANVEIEKEEKARTERSFFSLADAFLARDRKKSWLLYREYLTQGATPEELHGILSWQARALVIASKTESASASGLNPFVFGKAKKAAERIGNEEAERLSRELVEIYHYSRMGKGALAELLEAFLLEK